MGVDNKLVVTFFVILATVQGIRLGDKCMYDRDCEDVPQSFCERQQRCSCMRKFKPDEANERCIATVGADCKSDIACSTLQYSECRQEVCECQPGYVPHSTETECLPEAVSFRAPCLENLQCTNSLGDGSHCFQDKCICLPQFHSADSKCIPNLGLGQPCNSTQQCYVNDEQVDMISCADMKCGCRDPYVMDGNSCKGDGPRIVLSLAALILGLGFSCGFV